MNRKWILGFVTLILLFIVPSVESSQRSVQQLSKCDQFISDFKDMQLADQSIQESLISNHDMMIDSFEAFADALKETSGKSYKKVVENMYKSSESIRKRKTKAQEISKKFNKKMTEMLKTAEECVKK